MATAMQEVVRRLRIEASSTGVKEADQAVRSLADGFGQAEVKARGSERSTVSMERSLNSIQRRYDAAWRSQQQMAKIERDLNAARAQGLIDMQRQAELLSLAAERHGLATAAIHREEAATDALTSSIMRNAAANQNARAAGSFQTANIAAQFQDIGVTAAMGMSPMQIALQQGTQLSAILNTMENPVRGLAGAFASVINPVSLVTIGVIGLGAALIQYVTAGRDGAKALDDAFENHEAVLQRLDGLYEGFTDRLQQYRDSSSIAAAATRESLAVLEASSRVENMSLIDRLIPMRDYDQRTGQIKAMVDSTFQPFRDAILELDRAFATGQPNFEAFIGQVEDIVDTDPAGLRALGDEIILAAEKSYRAEAAINTAREAVEGLGRDGTSDVAALAQAMQDLETVMARVHSERARDEMKKLAEEAIDGKKSTDDLKAALADISGYAPDLSGAISEFLRLVQAARDARDEVVGFGGKESQGGRVRYNSTGFMPLPDSVGVTPTPRVDPYFDGPTPRSGSRGKSAAEKAAESYEKLLRQSEQFIAAQMMERDALYMTEEAAAALRYEHVLLARATNDNVELTPQMAAELRAYAAAMAQAEAETQRLREAMDFAEDVTRGFVDDFRSGIEQGKSDWESFASAALNALDKIVDKLLDDVMDALFQVNGAASGGGILGWIGKIIGGIGGGGLSPTGGVGMRWATGGYTGDGGMFDPAGIVHRGEYVFSAAATRSLGVGNLERMHRSANMGGSGAGGIGASAPSAGAAWPSEMRVKVDVGVSVDENGNLKAFVRNVSQETAQSVTRQGIEANNASEPDRLQGMGIAVPSRRRAGGGF